MVLSIDLVAPLETAYWDFTDGGGGNDQTEVGISGDLSAILEASVSSDVGGSGIRFGCGNRGSVEQLNGVGTSISRNRGCEVDSGLSLAVSESDGKGGSLVRIEDSRAKTIFYKIDLSVVNLENVSDDLLVLKIGS